MTSSLSTSGPLSGFRAVSLASNLPGPVAASLLVREGLSVTKVESPSDDMLRGAAQALYNELQVGMTVQTLDLRSPAGQQGLAALLQDADLLLTSQRPSALARLGVTTGSVARYPRLCWVEIVGDEDAAEVPGHDLTYQIQAGLVQPPLMPTTLISDLAGAQDAARSALALLLGRERGSSERHRRVGLKQAAAAMAVPVRHGLTTPGGWLSGALPHYRLYALRDGWVGVAALEPHFTQRLMEAVGEQDLERFLGSLSVDECHRLADEQDLPLLAFQESPEHRH